MIYVASSWRNKHQPYVVEELRANAFDVYDFRNPSAGNSGFQWSEIDRDWQAWGFDAYKAALNHEHAEEGFRLDREAVNSCDACVLVLPCGRSAHLELGHVIGQGKPGYILYPYGKHFEPELMYKWATLHNRLDELIVDLRKVAP